MAIAYGNWNNVAEGLFGADNGSVKQVEKKMVESRELFERTSADMDVLIMEIDTMKKFVKNSMASMHAGGARRFRI